MFLSVPPNQLLILIPADIVFSCASPAIRNRIVSVGKYAIKPGYTPVSVTLPAAGIQTLCTAFCFMAKPVSCFTMFSKNGGRVNILMRTGNAGSSDHTKAMKKDQSRFSSEAE